MSLRRRVRNQGEDGFTLLEIIVSLAVMSIIMVPLTAAFVNSIRQANDVETKVGSAVDAQRIASWWTKDVHSVEPTGVSDAELCRSTTGITSATDRPLISFQWDTSPSSGSIDSSGTTVITAKTATWTVVGLGPDAQLLRRYCENGLPVSETLIADSFWTSGYLASDLVYGMGGYGTTNFCTRAECTITVSGNYRYSLTVERRVPGLTDPVSSVPPAPEITGVIPSNGALTVVWLPSIVPDGTPPVSGYDVLIVREDEAGDTAEVQVDGSSLSARVDGLTNGTLYRVRVRARNSNGPGPYDTFEDLVTPVPEPPAAPTDVTAVPGNASATVSWTPPTEDGGAPIDSWRIRARAADTSEIIAIADVPTASAVSAVVGDLRNGTSTTFTVAAVNSTGEGAESQPSQPVVPCGPATAPPQPSVEKVGSLQAGEWIATGEIRVSWEVPEDSGGCPILHYRVRSTEPIAIADPGPWDSPTADTEGNVPTEFTTPVVPSGSYQFEVAAVTRFGEGAWSDPSAPASQETTPTIEPFDVSWEPEYFGTTGSGINTGGILRWIPLPNTPDYNGGFSIRAYEWTIDPVVPDLPPVSEYVVGANQEDAELGGMEQILDTAGVESYREYDVSVAAVNENGAGPKATLRVRAGGRPLESPANLEVVPWALRPLSPGVWKSEVRATWDAVSGDAPEVNGGVDLDGYTLELTSPSQANVPDVPINGWNKDFSDLEAVGGREYTMKAASRNSLGLSIPTESFSYTAPSAMSTPAASAIGVSRPAGTAGNRITLTVPGAAFTSNPGNPPRTYSATCESGAQSVTFPVVDGVNDIINPGLTNGLPFRCRVTATMAFPDGPANVVTSPWSANTVTPYTVPTAPQNLQLAQAGGGRIQVSWTTPQSSGGDPISAYWVAIPGVPGYPRMITSATSHTTDPLQFGTSYTITVTAANTAGQGPGASGTVQPSSSAPTVAPTGLTWEPIYPNGLKLTWTPVQNVSPGNGGLDLADQILTLSPAPTTGSATVLLPAGTGSYTYTTDQLNGSGQIINYTATIAATNADGTGPTTTTSAKSGGRPLASVPNLVGMPYAPNGAIRVEWGAITSNTAQFNGGKLIEGYNVYWRPVAGGAEKRTYVSGFNSSGANIGGLVPGTAYRFRVVASSEPYAAQGPEPSGAGVGDSAIWATVDWVAPAPPIVAGSATLVKHPTSSAFGYLRLTFDDWTQNAGSPDTNIYQATCRPEPDPSNPALVKTFTGLQPGVNNDLNIGVSNALYKCILIGKNSFPLSSSEGVTERLDIPPAYTR